MPHATPRASGEHTPRRTHLGYLIADAVELFPDRLAVTGAGGQMTYGELDERAERVAAALAGRGVGAGDRVALLWGNHVDYIPTFLGALRSGAVVCPLNVRLGDEALRYVLDDAGAVALLPGPGLEARAAELAADSPGLRVTAGITELVSTPGTAPRATSASGDVCLQPYTSGSTGRPKGVLLTHAGQIWNVETVRRVLLIDEDDRAVIAIPLFHANAAIQAQVFLRAGGTLVIHESFDPTAVLRSIEDYRCTFMGGVPAMFGPLIAARRGDGHRDLSSLRVAMVGSADVPDALCAAFEDAFGIPLAEGYGLTEGGPYVTLTPRWGVKKRASAGLALPGCEIEVRSLDDPSTTLDTGTRGELWVRNPGVAVGYHNLPELSEERLQDGWLATGDLATIDSDGYLTLAGRRDDLINVGGENVYPREVEEILLSHPDVAQACVAAVTHPDKGAVPVAAVVPVPAAELHEGALSEFFRERGPAYACPRRIVVVGALPVLGTGKADRAAVRVLCERG